MKTSLAAILRTALQAATPIRSADPWEHIATTAVGTAFAAGFDQTRDELIVVSSAGQGIFDCRTGEKIYRNYDDTGYNVSRLEAVRLDDPTQPAIKMAGIDGGALRRGTDDGWHVETIQLDWPESYSILQPPNASIYFHKPELAGYNKDASFQLLTKTQGLPWAFGFSWTGKSLIWMDGSDLHIWSRK